MKRIVGGISGFLFAAATLLALGTDRAEAAVWWPASDRNYYCNWELPDPAHPGQVIYGASTIHFANLQGNNYLRRGYLQTWYPSGAFSETAVTITKPVSSCPDCTTFELTTGSGIQCKDFRTIAFGAFLYFDQCSNGARQSCQ
jgi:hypothetical protein